MLSAGNWQLNKFNHPPYRAVQLTTITTEVKAHTLKKKKKCKKNIKAMSKAFKLIIT